MRLFVFLTILIVFFLSIGYNEATRLTDEENKILQAECGKTVNTSDAEGISAERAKAPWLINYRNGNLSCSGVLISRKHFVTARHCLTKNITTPSSSNKDCTSEKDFLLQISNLELEIDSPMTTKAEARLLEFCKESTPDYLDLSVITLPTDLQLSDTINPVCVSSELEIVPSKKEILISGNAISVGSEVSVSSFGFPKSSFKSGKPNSRAGRVFSTEKLQIGLPTAEKNAHEANDWHIAGTRAGDSGSGAVVQKSGRYFLAGIVSRKNTKSLLMDISSQAAKICTIFNICP
ncbi:hypothetical protein B9Z55_025288 [Caenorhabditis nigoni]|uniref:Peptidase S1 domain-containing protein n=1 Tax=Caenorhabditis nigoni TaxID=1611254 RepID=A0A2G5SYL0_9PELO|nr:hypothetical protein B9Z55_025288 [Caenorhabditis nigoni]